MKHMKLDFHVTSNRTKSFLYFTLANHKISKYTAYIILEILIDALIISNDLNLFKSLNSFCNPKDVNASMIMVMEITKYDTLKCAWVKGCSLACVRYLQYREC